MTETRDDLPPPHPLLDLENPPLPKSGLLRRQAWLTFLLPFIVYMLVGYFEPSPPDPKTQKEIAELREEIETGNAAAKQIAEQRLAKIEDEEKHAIPYKYYPRVYTIKIVATAIAMLLVIPGYKPFACRPSMLGLIVGVVGAVLWVAICKFHPEERILEPLGLSKLLDMTRRPGFNPLAEISDKSWAYQFLAIRFFGLIVIVPIMEEFFLRGFLMRYVMHIDWPYIPFGVLNRLGIIAGTAYGMLAHPAEIVAAAVWFSLVTWLMLRTKCIWDCVIAHAVTNGLMGAWVLYSGDWWLM